MANSNSGRHARKVTLDAAVSNAIAKAVDARKVAAFTVGAAGVLAGAAFAFGATPAMAAENGAAAGAASVPVEAGKKPGVEAEIRMLLSLIKLRKRLRRIRLMLIKILSKSLKKRSSLKRNLARLILKRNWLTKRKLLRSL